MKKRTIKIILFILILLIICLMISPVKLLKNNFFGMTSLAVSNSNTTNNRYYQSEETKTIYVDGSGNKYIKEINPTSKTDTQMLSYEDIVYNNKNMYIAEMETIPYLNYEKKFLDRFSYIYDDNDQEKINKMLEMAKLDSTISKNEIVPSIWNLLNLNNKYIEIKKQDQVLKAKRGYNPFGNTGDIIARTRTLAIYNTCKNAELIKTSKNNDKKSITAGEAYLMACTRTNSNTINIDKIQQGIWKLKYNIDEIPNEFLGINPEAGIVGDNAYYEAKTLDTYIDELNELKNNNNGQEIVDNMLKNNTNRYQEGLAGLVAYDEESGEYLVGPFSIDYIRKVYVPEKGGQNENQNKEGIIIFSGITDSEIYGLDLEGNEVKIDDWEFIYTDVQYDVKTEKAQRIAEINAINNGDITPNIYPYPNENFYIRFKDDSIKAITKLEFKMKNIDAEAEAYLLKGKYYNVSWKSTVDSNGNSYLQMSPNWDEINSGRIRGIDSADIYQLKSAKVVNVEKFIQLSVGNYIDDDKFDKEYSGYCIPITMELGGNVWFDGTEYDEVKKPDKIFGIKGDYDDEFGIENVNVYLYDINNDLIDKSTTDKNGDYLFKYVKLGKKYYIEFEYDGMKYKATKYLNGESGRGNYEYNFMEYLNFSHAKEDYFDREKFNNTYAEIKNGFSRNEGQAISLSKEISDLEYSTENFDKEYIGGKASIKECKFKARTLTTDLLYPLHKSYIITNKDISIIDQNQKDLDKRQIYNTFVLGKYNEATNLNFIVKTKQGEKNVDIEVDDNFITESTISYTMVDTYLHHINLGLIERTEIDLAVKNDIVQTNHTTKDPRIFPANINGFGTKDTSEKSFDIDSRSNVSGNEYFKTTNVQGINYNDYTWRYYFTNNPYATVNDNLQYYVQYKMTIRNQSELLSGCVTELVNYYSNDLYYPVDTNEVWRYYDKKTNYKDDPNSYASEILSNIPVSSWAIKNAGTEKREDLGQVIWNSNSKFGPENNKDLSGTGLQAMYTNSLADLKLEVGEYVDIYVIYKVEVRENPLYGKNGELYIVNDNSSEGKKNIIEINSYKAFNIDGTEGGRVDKDSAPGNSEIDNYVTYEDDIDMAPYFRIEVTDKNNGKSITGYVWEDETNFEIDNGDNKYNLGTQLGNNQRVGNGVIDKNPYTGESYEKYIDNVMVELIPLEYNPNTQQYEEVEFTEEFKNAYKEKYEDIYPEFYEKDDVSEFALITWTGLYGKNLNSDQPLKKGQYRFDNLIEGGKYKVRFTYGTEGQLRTELKTYNSNVYSGHDYKSTEYNGRIDLNNNDPSTEIAFVIDSYEIIGKEEKPIINVFKNLTNNLKLTNKNINYKILDYGAWELKMLRNFDEVGKGEKNNRIYSASSAIHSANTILKTSTAKNKIMVIYIDGYDFDEEYVRNYIKKALEDDITVIGIGYGSESLGIFKVTADNGESPFIYTLNNEKNNNQNIESKIYDVIVNKLINKNYFIDDVSHAEDYIRNTTYNTILDNKKSVTGRLEVLEYSKEMDPIIADTLNINYINSLTKDTSLDSSWSVAIKQLADKTKMTADSYIIDFDYLNNQIVEKNINLGLQEIPKRTIEVTNEVDNIVVTLSNGRKLIDLKNGINKNVQIIPDDLFSVYMDEEIMQGATIKVTYKIHISNIGEVDSLYSYLKYATNAEKRKWYSDLTGNKLPNDNAKIDEILKETVPIKISKLYSYYDNLVFRAEDNNRWEIINNTVSQDKNTLNVQRDNFGNLKYVVDEDSIEFSRDNIRRERVVWSAVENPEILHRNKENVEKYSIVETTSLKDIELYPNKSKEVMDNLNNESINRPISTICTYLVLSKTLSSEDIDKQDALKYKNYVEIIRTSSDTGRRDYNAAEGNFMGGLDKVSENDIDNAERVIILPPFGDKKIMIGFIISCLLIISMGIIGIKKKIL